MIRHIVLFRLKDKSPENLKATAELFYSLRGQVPGLISVETGVDFYRTERSYDIALVCTFTDRAALEAYQTHPAHVPIRKHMHEIRESSVACDYELPD